MSTTLPKHWAYDYAEPETSEFVEHIYHLPDDEFVELLVPYLEKNPSWAKRAILGDIQSDFEEEFFWDNRDALLREYKQRKDEAA